MAKRVGIRQNAVMKEVSGCKVPFDPRTTAEVCDSRDDKNYKAAEEMARKLLREERQREQRGLRESVEENA